MYVCMYVCMYTYVLLVSHVSARSCTCACTYVSMTYVRICICARTWVHVRWASHESYTYVRMRICFTWFYVSCMRWASHESYAGLHNAQMMLLHIVLL